MKIPDGTRPGFYWVKYDGRWYPARIENAGLRRQLWRVEIPGFYGIINASACHELGPKLVPPSEPKEDVKP